jgi:hypothetical protein
MEVNVANSIITTVPGAPTRGILKMIIAIAATSSTEYARD